MNKPLPGQCLVPLLQLLSLKVTRSLAEEEINGNGFWKEKTSSGAHESLRMPLTHPTFIFKERSRDL